MPCKSCKVDEMIYEISFEKLSDLTALEEIIDHLKRIDLLVEVNEKVLKVKEQGINELYDFCVDHLEMKEIQFRVDDTSWRPFSEVAEVLETQWIDKVIKNEQLTCHYQPIVDREENIYAYEMLARFYRLDGTIIYPNEIFAAARLRGRLYALDRVCRLTAVHYAAKINKKAFINFIPTSIYSPEYCLRTTVHLAKKLGIDPYQLVFEVVETEKIEDLDHLKSILKYYDERGFKYALDDVGEGHSTIEVLSHLKPHYMKLDMKYVQGVATDVEKQKVANQFLEKAKAIGSVPLAEGIEERVDFEWLKERGYELFQGYYFGKPSKEPKV